MNKSRQSNSNETERKQTDNQLTYRQAFKKKDRLLLATLRFGYIDDLHKGYLKANTEFYKTGIVDSVSNIDQQKTFTGGSKTLGSRISFVEPLSPKWNFVVEYSYNNNRSKSNKNTYNLSSNGKYEVLDSVFSNNFDLNAFSHSGNTFIRYTDKKFRLTVGSGLSAVKLQLHDLDKNTHKVYNFLNATPQTQLTYSIKQQTRLGIYYQGTTKQPTINQLQPLRDNNDPLNILVGNPNLKVGFNHTMNVWYNSYKVLKTRSIYANFNFNLTQNAITNSNNIDVQTGKRTYMPINVNGNQNWNLWSGWFKGGGNKKWNYRISLDANGGRYVNFTNGQKNKTDYATYELNTGIGYSIDEKFNFNVGPKIGYNSSVSSLQTSTNNNFYSYGGRAEAYFNLPWKLEISSDLDVNLRERVAFFSQSANVIQWNGSLSRKIFKKKSGKIILVANDILNQNKGYNRNISSNFISEERFLRVARYFLLKFEWTFNKTPGK